MRTGAKETASQLDFEETDALDYMFLANLSLLLCMQSPSANQRLA
jgi:hypothetical protein